MASRATKSGINADTQRKILAKYDEDVERKLRLWFEEMLGEPLEPQEIGRANFQLALRDGVKLCQLINKIEPGSVKKINQGKLKTPFTLMENIDKFNQAIKAYGVNPSCTFQSCDLFESQDMSAVQNTIWSLASMYIKKGGTCVAGVKVAHENKREFDEETLNAGQSIIGLQMGSNKGASQTGMTAMGTSRRL